MTNPRVFSRVRFEHEERPLYFLPTVMHELEAPKCRYIIGHRGTGKTTLLRALNWTERLDNESLRSQLGPDPLSARFIGLYLKVPRHNFTRVDEWLADVDVEIAACVFSWYFDALWLQLAAAAVAELIARGKFVVSPEIEALAISEALEDYEGLEVLGTVKPANLQDMKRSMRAIQLRIEAWATRKSDPLEAAVALPGQAGEFGRQVGPKILSLCRSYRPDGDESKLRVEAAWRFQICLDEAEALSARQQLALNTIVRLSESPVFITGSFISRPADVTSTVIPQLTLQHADFELTVRDEMSPKEFKQLINGVATMRVRAELRASVGEFDVDNLLGPTDLNLLLEERIAGSESGGPLKLTEDAQLLEVQLEQRIGNARRSSSLPIWEAYALRKLKGRIPEIPKSTALRFPDGNLRKRSITTFFAIHQEYRWTPRYVGSSVAVHLADSCIRDFLWEMDEILSLLGDQANSNALERLMSGEVIAGDLQSTAFANASRKKMGRLKEFVTASPEAANNLVMALGKRTQRAQRATETQALDAEPGIFVLVAGPAPEFDEASALIRDAVEAGYLKMVEQKMGDPWSFRLHSSLAPYFEISWRGAYRSQKVTPREILDYVTRVEEEPEVPRRADSRSRATRSAVSSVQPSFEFGDEGA